MRQPLQRKYRVLWLIVSLAVAAVMTAYGCADRFVLHLAPDAVSSEGAVRRILPHSRGVIEIFTARSPGAAKAEPRAFVLRFTGGIASEAAPFTASRWRHRPMEVWVANYSGYGGSTGPRKLKAMGPAAVAAYDELHRVAAGRPIFLGGFSLGTVPALHAAANRPVAGLILQNPPPLRELILGAHGWWNLWLLAGPIALGVPSELDSVTNARRCTAPAVFLLADSDRSIPPRFQQKIVDAYAGEKRLIVQHGADHVTPLSEEDEQSLQQAMDWLLSPPSTTQSDRTHAPY